VTVRGLDGEQYTAPSGQVFGLTSSPPVGSVGYAFAGNGRPDQAFLLNLEHPDFRPVGQDPGAVKLYGQAGQFIGMGSDGNLVISAPGEVRPQ
jgi:phage gp45-like